MKKKLIALTGAGISAESGIKTFRDDDGLWEGYDVMEVATRKGFKKNPALVLDFYKQRRKQLKEVVPNSAHFALKQLELNYEVHIITQNVDDLHERAGSCSILHLHGELKKVRSLGYPYKTYNWDNDLTLEDRCENGFGLRPHIVWFGEEVPALEEAASLIIDTNFVLVIGSSMQVYPAAGLVGLAPKDAQVFYIDPSPTLSFELQVRKNLKVMPMKATEGMDEILKILSQSGN